MLSSLFGAVEIRDLRLERVGETRTTQLAHMLFHGGGGGGGGGAAAAAARILVRYFSRKRGQDVRRINPKVPREEASEISKGLYQIVKDHGPLTVANTWNFAKDASINGLNSKTHMKIMLKWMTGRKMLKLSCTHIGSSKKFLYSTLPEDPKAAQPTTPSPVTETLKISVQGKKKERRPNPPPPKKGVDLI